MNWMFKKENGIVLARKIANYNAIVIGKRFRVINERKIWVHHVISDSKILFVCHGFSTSIMNDCAAGSERAGVGRDEIRRGALRVHYPGKVVIVCSAYSNETFVANDGGYVLAGSNIHNNGAYCVGEDVNPLTLHPAEAIMMNKANNDLAWRGDLLVTKKQTENSERIVEKWPHLRDFMILTPSEIEMISMLQP